MGGAQGQGQGPLGERAGGLRRVSDRRAGPSPLPRCRGGLESPGEYLPDPAAPRSLAPWGLEVFPECFLCWSPNLVASCKSRWASDTLDGPKRSLPRVLVLT